MERLLRIGGQGIGGMGSQSPESSQNDTAEQVPFFKNFSIFFLISISSPDSYLITGTVENDETRPRWCAV